MINQDAIEKVGIGMTSQRTRLRMVDRLRKDGIENEAVLSAMATVPRHLFVEEAFASRAYEDSVLPLGFSQTISQPFVVARMIEVLLQGRRGLGKTLEVGAGCGYQAAVLGQLAPTVVAIERIQPLMERARANLARIGQKNVDVRYADGSLGAPERAPFDTIILAAAAQRVPAALLQQLALGGRMILPLGVTEQTLLVIDREAGGFRETPLEAVRFVPLLAGIE